MAPPQQHRETLLVDRLLAGISGSAREDRRRRRNEFILRAARRANRKANIDRRKDQRIRARLRARKVLLGCGEHGDPGVERRAHHALAVGRKRSRHDSGADRDRATPRRGIAEDGVEVRTPDATALPTTGSLVSSATLLPFPSSPSPSSRD